MRRRAFRDIVAAMAGQNIQALMKKARMANRIAKLPGLGSEAKAEAYRRKGAALSVLRELVSDTRIDIDARYGDLMVLSFELPEFRFRLHILPWQLTDGGGDGLSKRCALQ